MLIYVLAFHQIYLGIANEEKDKKILTESERIITELNRLSLLWDTHISNSVF